ncbi:MAG: hypothetical protein KGL39_46870 [Patescibacteria group bacterium]|nr:hypothetical protein [Patescibacteria group bacterium]
MIDPNPDKYLNPPTEEDHFDDCEMMDLGFCTCDAIAEEKSEWAEDEAAEFAYDDAKEN